MRTGHFIPDGWDILAHLTIWRAFKCLSVWKSGIESSILEKGKYMKAAQRIIHWYDYLTFNAIHFGLSTMSQTLSTLVIPLFVQQFVGEAQKASYYGNLRLWGLMMALLAQSFWGMLSDHSTSRWGRRRPYVVGGVLGASVLALMMVSTGTLGAGGLAGYWLLFGLYVVFQFVFNAGQGAAQGFLPDLVPQNFMGRFSAVKSLLEVPLPVIFSSFVIAPLIAGGSFWGGMLAACGVLLVTMLLTLLVREEPLRVAPPALDWKPFLRLGLMTAFFTLLILGMGELVRQLGSLIAGVESLPVLLWCMGGLGLVVMLAAIGLGVWVSIRIGVGSSAGSSFTAWVINRLAFLAGVFNLSSFTVYFLQAHLSLPKEQAVSPASRLMLFVGVCIFLFAALSGWLADRFSRRGLLVVAGLLAALGTLIAILSTNLPVLYAGGCLIGAGTGLFYTASWALGTRLVSKSEAGRYLGISNLAGAGAGAVGAYIGGPIADFFTGHVPAAPGIGYVLLFGIYGLLFLFSILALFWIKEPVPASS